MTTVIEVKDLVKRYAEVEAVKGISFRIEEGVCFGLLGPNGAGKTTTVEILEGITEPTSGSVFYRGRPLDADFREKTGIQFQETALQDHLSVREVLNLFSSFYRKPADREEIIAQCALAEFLDRDTRRLSGGQRQRLLLALALVNDPDVLFLDEPTTGLDPQARRNFWGLIESIKARRKTIVLTTHYMEEAYALCDEIAIMDHGRIIAHGAPDQLLKQHFDGVSIELPKQDCRLGAGQAPGRLFERDGFIEIQTSEVKQTLQRLIESGSNLSRLKVRSQTLEDLFLELTGRELRP